MSQSLPQARARAARAAVSALFFVNGAVSASILPRLPAIKDALHLSNTELGTAVAAMPVGGLIAGGLVGILIARFGSGRLGAVAGAGSALMLAIIGLAPSWIALAGGYLVLGMFDAAMDASMNAHSLGVQRAYGRSILQGFHGAWSVGGMTGGAAGALAAAAGVPVEVHLTAAAVLLLAVLAVAAPSLLPAAVADTHQDVAEDAHPAERLHPSNAPRLLRLLVPVAMLGILCVVVQSAASTWSAVFLTDVMGLAPGFAAVGFVVYMGSMTAGRLLNDRWVDRFGSIVVVRVGALIAAAGLAGVMAAAPLELPLLAFAGFAVIGVGTSPMFPVMFGAAGTRPGLSQGYGVALVAWLVRIGLMIAPALVGLAADSAGLAAAFVIPLVVALGIAALAPVLTGRRAVAGRPVLEP